MIIEQFGVSVSALSHNWVPQLAELNPDLIQVPLHMGLPDDYVIDMLADHDTRIIGKLVPDPRMHDRKFFAGLAQRYKDRISIWDFGGEPETRPHQPGCRWAGTAAEFVALFREFKEEIKAVNPDAQVGAGGFIAPTFNGLYGNESRFGFLDELFAEGLGRGADYFSLNMYVYGYGGTKNFTAGILMFRELTTRYREHGKLIVVSETGVPAGGDPKFLHIIQTPERQAASLVETHLLCYALGVDYSIWYTFRHPAWGIIDGAGKPRPAFSAFKNLIRVAKGCEYSRTLKALPNAGVDERWMTDKINWHVLTRPDGKELHVVWMSGGLGLARHLVSGILDDCNIYGSSIQGAYFMLDESPKYFLADPGKLHSGNFLVT